MPALTPNLWFDTQALDAAQFYVSVFPDSAVDTVSRFGEGMPGEPGSVMTVQFHLGSTRFTAINGGPHFTLTPAVSFAIDCADQAEVDYYWDALTAGGSEQPCGWLQDRYGVSWQVIPRRMGEALGHPDPERAQRAAEAMMTMRKLDIAVLLAAAGLSED